MCDVGCRFSLPVRRSRSDYDAKQGGWLHHRDSDSLELVVSDDNSRLLEPAPKALRPRLDLRFVDGRIPGDASGLRRSKAASPSGSVRIADR